jgi:hypothetical protein
MVSRPLTWKDCAARERLLPKWIPTWIGFRFRWAMARDWVSQQLELREQAGWKPQSELHALICRIAVKVCGWKNGCFELNDDLRVAFWAFDDGLDTEFAFSEIESRLKVKFSVREMELAMSGTIESFLEILLKLRNEDGRIGD